MRAREAPTSILVFVVMAGLALLAVCFWLQYHGGFFFWSRFGFAFGNDDAFISYRYAKNLIDAGILSFNVNDQPFVEGFSNPLHVLLSALVYTIVGKDALYSAMALLGALFTGAAYLLLIRAAHQRLGLSGAIALAIAVALCPPIWIHSVDGLETPQVLLLQVVIWLAARNLADGSDKRSLPLIVLATVLSVSCRTDGFVFPLIVGAWLALRRHYGAAAAVLVTLVLTFLILLAARYGYYGEVWPNTYYAKINGSLADRFDAAARLLGSIAYKNGLVVSLLAVLGAIVVYLRKVLRSQAECVPPLESWTFLGVVVYYFLIGGDIYRDRFLLILFPLGLWAGLEALKGQARKPGWAVALALVATAAQLSAFAVDPRLDWRFHDGDKWDRWVFLGNYLGERYPSARLATSSAGKIPYYSGLETIDILGLNDKHIARTPAKAATPGHGRYDTDYVLAKRPDIIAMYTYGDGDLVFGMARSKYEPAGYRLSFLVKNEDMAGEPILSVSGLDEARVAELIKQGYNYGVVLRQ